MGTHCSEGKSQVGILGLQTDRTESMNSSFSSDSTIAISSAGNGKRPSQAHTKILDSPRSIVFYGVSGPFFKKGILINRVFGARFRVPHAGNTLYKVSASHAPSRRFQNRG